MDDKFKNAELIEIKHKVNEIISIAVSESSEEIKNDLENWSIYNRKYNNTKFNYLTKTEGFTYPAKFRNVGQEIIRSKLNLLESRQRRREFRFKAIAMDERSLEEKVKNKIKAYLKTTSQMYEERNKLIEFEIQKINDQLSNIQSQLEIQPENEQMAAQLEELRANYPMINFELQKMIRLLQREQFEVNEFNQKLQYNLRFTEQEIIEQIANASIKASIQKDDLIESWLVAFREKLVTGKPSFLVYYDTRAEKVVFKQVDSKDVFYSRGGSNKWTNKGEWCAVRETMDYSQIASEFELTDLEHNLVKMNFEGNYEGIRNYFGNSAIFDPVDGKSFKATEVWRVWYNCPRDVYYKISPNKHHEQSFYNIIDKTAKLKPNEKKRKITVFDQYYCVVIGGSIYINYGKNNGVFRQIDEPALPQLPLVARTHNKISDKPYCPIDRVKDLADLYNIVNYKQEMTIALAGIKGMIMDKSQKPEGWTTEKWMYYRKLGTMWIETMKKGRKVPASFNQFQNYDDGLSESIQWYDLIKNNIEMLISKIMGVTPSAEGQFVSKDPVANVKMSNEQSSLITEFLFHDNDIVFGKALELMLNLKAQYEWNKGKVMNYLDKDLEETLITIPENLLNKANFTMYTSNNIKEDTMLEDVRQIAIQSWARQELPLQALVSLFKIDDLKQMEEKLIMFSKNAEELRTQNAMAIDENKANLEQKTAQLKAQIDMEIEQFKQQAEQARLELDKAMFEFEQQKFTVEQQYKERELQIKSNLDILKVSSENDIESAYLEEEGRNNRVMEILKSYELKINSILQQLGIEANEIQSVRKTKVDLDKNMRNKNNIKDN